MRYTVADKNHQDDLAVQPKDMCCSFCGRSSSDIKWFIKSPTNSRGNRPMDIFYATKGNYPAYGRCVSEFNLTLRNMGNAVLLAYPNENSWVIDENYYPRLQLSRVVDFGVSDDQEMSVQGVNFKL